MKIRKFTFLFILLLLTSLLVSPVSASEKLSDYDEAKNTCIYEVPVITDADILYDRALSNESDAENNLEFTHEIELDDKTAQMFRIEKHNTTQKVKEIKLANGEKEQKYVTTFITDIYPLSSGWDEEPTSQYDDSYSVRAYVQVSYWYRVENIGNFRNIGAKLDAVEAWWERAQSTVSIDNAYVKLGEYGREITDWSSLNRGSLINRGTFPVSRFIDSPVENTPYSKVSTWDEWIDVYQPNCFVGGKSQITLIRGGDSWSLPLELKIDSSDFY